MYTPVNMKRSSHYGSNYWESYSPKLKRVVRLFSDLEYDNWILIETNPLIKTYCEQPETIRYQLENGAVVEAPIDMWVKWQDDSECFIEVKYQSELIPGSKKSERSIRQTTAQRKWCNDNGHAYFIKTELEIRGNKVYLSNMKKVLASVRSSISVNDIVKHQITKAIADSSITIEELKNSLIHIPEDRIINAVCWMLYSGEAASSNIDKVVFGYKTEVFIDVKKENN